MYWLPRSITICGTCEDAALSRYTSGLPWTVWLSTGKSLRIRSTSQTSTGLGLIVINCSKVAIFETNQTGLSSANLQIRAQPIQNSRIELSLERCDLNLLDHFFGEPVSQKVAREFRSKAAAFEIKDFVFFQLTNRRAMRALHVIGKNLKLWFGIHLRFVRQQQVLIRLQRVGLLRAVTHKDFAIEDRPRLAIENAFVELMAGAMRLAVIDHRMRVGVLVATNHVESVDVALGAFMIHRHVDAVSRKRRAEVD